MEIIFEEGAASSGLTPLPNVPGGDLEGRTKDLRSHEFRHDEEIVLMRNNSDYVGEYVCRNRDLYSWGGRVGRWLEG